jgi:hypothetical protein
MAPPSASSRTSFITSQRNKTPLALPWPDGDRTLINDLDVRLTQCTRLGIATLTAAQAEVDRLRRSGLNWNTRRHLMLWCGHVRYGIVRNRGLHRARMWQWVQ